MPHRRRGGGEAAGGVAGALEAGAAGEGSAITVTGTVKGSTVLAEEEGEEAGA